MLQKKNLTKVLMPFILSLLMKYVWDPVILYRRVLLLARLCSLCVYMQGDCDVEWKFARTRLWMMYITQGTDGSTLFLLVLILFLIF